jgi:hypothetical protein
MCPKLSLTDEALCIIVDAAHRWNFRCYKDPILGDFKVVDSCAFEPYSSYFRLLGQRRRWSVLKMRPEDSGDTIHYSEYYFLDGDTLIDGLAYQRVFTLVDSLFDPASVNRQYAGAIREAGMLVTFRAPGSSWVDTMYNFALKEGDIFRRGIDDAGQPFHIYVKKIDYIQLDNYTPRRRYELYFRYDNGRFEPPGPSITWIEGMGDLERGLLSPNCFFERDYDCLNQLLCYWIWIFRVYQNDRYQTCFLSTTSNSPVSSPGSFRLFPNPATDILQVSLEGNYTEGHLRIIDLQGRIRKTAALPAGAATLRISLEGLAPGLYFLHLTRQGKAPTAKRFFVH